MKARSTECRVTWWRSDAACYAGCVLLLMGILLSVRQRFYLLGLPFDDAFMFSRYAINMHAGHGVAWNPGGPPVYGPTSLAWLAVIWAVYFVSHSLLHVVVGSSLLAGVLAMVAVAWTVYVNAESRLFRRFPVVLLIVLACSLTMFSFLSCTVNGMETTFSYGVLALLLGTFLLWQKGKCAWYWVSLLGMLASLSRPESALATCLLIAGVAWTGIPAQKRQAAAAVSVFLGLLASQVLLCKLYFGSPVPLSFYLKSQHSYIGYIARWFPVTELFESLRSSRVSLLIIGLLASWRERRLIFLCLIPAAACMLYLTRTLQIMGFWSRYYLPYSVFLLILALLLIDRWQRDRERIVAPAAMGWPACAVLVAVCGCLALGAVPQRWIDVLDRRSEGELHAYHEPRIDGMLTQPLLMAHQQELLADFTKRLVARLPPGSTVASSEVGYLAGASPEIKIIDLVGLNDTDIARHGFHMEYLLRVAPDVIWMPHLDYTHQRAVMMSDPRFLAAYDFYPGIARFGLAVRKDGPLHEEVMAAVRQFWQEAYPNLTMHDHLAHSVTWDGEYQVVSSR